MAIAVICRFADGNRQIVSDAYASLRDAVSAALSLADLHGDDRGDGHGPPKRIEVCIDDQLELSVAVIRGGLSG